MKSIFLRIKCVLTIQVVDFYTSTFFLNFVGMTKMNRLKMLGFDLGDHNFKISTKSKKAQTLFDLGLNWCFAFNHDEGLACFKEALREDPECAMLYWGIAYAAGPFYNMPWCDFSEEEAIYCTAFCRQNLNQALYFANQASALEEKLIWALSQRVQKPKAVSQTEFNKWDDAYANAMRVVNSKFPRNLDVMALTIEAMMTRTPWKMWDVKTGLVTENADTLEAIALCKEAIALADANGQKQHPAILHLHIHLIEMSNQPEDAMESADRLRNMCPDAGHIHHMPGHIYVLCGQYEKAKKTSEKAIQVNRKYLAYAGPYNYYTIHRCHDLHLMMYACMLLGQFKPTIAAAEEICENLTPDVINLKGKPFIAGSLEGYFAMKAHALVRFGKWEDIIEEPIPEDRQLYCVSTAMLHYSKVVAYAALKQFEAAEKEKQNFYSSLKNINPGRKIFNNLAIDILGVGEMMLLGELEYHKGNYEVAFGFLRESVKRSDNLNYSEPWPWMHPPRHALGALLLEQQHFEEAESVYRADLGMSNDVYRCAQHKNNVWALHGLVECRKHSKADEELQKLSIRLEQALSKTDFEITSSCCCRMSPPEQPLL